MRRIPRLPTARCSATICAASVAGVRAPRGAAPGCRARPRACPRCSIRWPSSTRVARRVKPDAGAERLEQHLRVHRADQLAQRLAAGADDLHGAFGLDLPQALDQHVDLLLDERAQRLAVAERVVDREAERLVVAALAE